ncbi:hypothetical protein RHGRI_035572 [Rhododendron griersonianum]|uniref:Poly [ADP-ribose] polymerase n=1 Tax=Rhododendron griersonianum TaxID=479676 RepID=A0AAV6HKJ3_9ERIC|nr:hypothetical protein RHGRI_035572 [Rhododendron griersonianum]
MATLADSFLAHLDELSDNEANLPGEDNVDTENKEEDIDGDMVDIENLDSVSKLQKTQRYIDIMKKVEDALVKGSDMLDNGMVLEDDPEYQLIVDCNALSVDIENEIVIIHNFIRGKYWLKFSELESLVHHPIDYARVVKKIGNEMDLTLVDLEGLLTSVIIMVVSVTVSTTIGKPLLEEGLQKTIDACDRALALDSSKKKVLDFVESRMGYIAPNLSAIVGSVVAAKLMGTAGGLSELAKMPAGHVQFLGAKKKNFAAFSTARSQFRLGYIGQAEILQSTPPSLRLRGCRVLAARSTLAARVDSFREDPTGKRGIAFRDQIHKKFEKWHEERPAKQPKPLPVPDSEWPSVEEDEGKVRRLESAVREESKQSIDSTADGSNSTLKRRREETQDGDSNGADKIQAVEKLRGMDIRKLRKEAELRGVSTTGSKKELLQRLCADSHDSNAVIEAKEEDAIEIKEEKIVTATKKGAAVLDQWLPDEIKAMYHVLQQGDEIYDAMLNQTNVGENNNKFYVIQVLESDNGGRFMVYCRWGRVGVKGQDKLHGPYSSQDSAIQEFEQKFLAKTRNYWSNRKEFICHPRSYAWLEMDYTDREKESDVKGKSDATVGVQLRETRLESRIAKFLSLICNVSMMKQQMMEIVVASEPNDIRSYEDIGYDVLKKIADVIGKSNRTKLELLSGEFYTVIPHDFGFKKMREFVIDTPQKLKSKLEMVEALGEIELATKLLADDVLMQEDPLCSHYQRLCCELSPLEVDSKEFSTIATYIKNTHAKTHSGYGVDIVQIFRVSREGEEERFRKMPCLPPGLRIAPPEAPATGYMFGKGVYFADMFSKSANYCYSSSACTAGVLLLCEVALGDMAELLTANYNAEKLPEGKLSTKGVGATAPDLSEAQMLEDGVVVPLGKPKEQVGTKGALLYNEYIVYNVDQIRMRYLVQVDFNFRRFLKRGGYCVQEEIHQLGLKTVNPSSYVISGFAL